MDLAMLKPAPAPRLQTLGTRRYNLHGKGLLTDKLKVSMFTLALALASCSEGVDEAGVSRAIVLDSASISMMQPGMADGMGPGSGMGPMAGMDPRMMNVEWERHMAAMQSALPDSLRAMMHMHRPMVDGMMESMGGRTGMAMDSTMVATHDSLQRSLEHMPALTREERDAILRRHDEMMQGMMRMRQAAPSAAR